jgi:hypothetical protein
MTTNNRPAEREVLTQASKTIKLFQSLPPKPSPNGFAKRAENKPKPSIFP